MLTRRELLKLYKNGVASLTADETAVLKAFSQLLLHYIFAAAVLLQRYRHLLRNAIRLM